MRPFEQGTFILQDRDGDYVKLVEAHLSETVHSHFIFTKDREEARKFSYADLYSPLNVHGIGTEFAAGFAGSGPIQVA